MNYHRFVFFYICILLSFIVTVPSCSVSYLVGEDDNKSQNGITITFSKDHYSGAIDGRLILLISDNNDTEMRFQLRDDSKTCQGFGMDVNEWKAGQLMPFALNAFGYPIKDFKDLSEGEYYVQAVFHKYETFHRADGHVVKLPMDRGEGQQWNRAPGNLYSTPKKNKNIKRRKSSILNSFKSNNTSNRKT